MILDACRAGDELVALAFANPDAAPGAAARHAEGCAVCRENLDMLRRTAGVLRAHTTAEVPGEACLDDARLAGLGDDPGLASAADLAHLSECQPCAARLAGTIQLLADAGVAAELGRLDGRRGRRQRRLAAWSGASLLAAATIAALMLRPAAPGPSDATGVHRESGITATLPPRIVAPLSRDPVDTLRWTAVPHADRYQVLLFDRDGTLLWGPQTADTAIALPAALRSTPATYLWKVEARTDWNRWVASEWAELHVRSAPR